MAVLARPADSAAMAELGDLLLGMAPAELEAFLLTLDAQDLAIVNEAHARAVAAQRAIGWRANPYTMACHLEGDGYERYRFHQYLAASFRDAVTGVAPFQIWNTPAQVGKGLALDTPILTPTGWTTMGALRVGDQVFSGAGTPCTVTGVSPIRHLDCYRLTFHDGATLLADGDHQWKVWDSDTVNPADRRPTGRPKAGTVAPPRRAGSERGSWQVVDTRKLRAGGRRYRLPACPGVTFPDADLPIHPYALGAWLGDGTSASAGFTCADDELLDHLADVGEPARRCTGSSDPYACTFAGTRDAPSTFQARLRAIGVLGAKHIPDQYLFAGDKQRLWLLQGLMDTDGHISRRPSGFTQCEYTGTNQRLVEGVQVLARSLGIRATIHEGRATIGGVDKGPKWRVTFTTDLPVFRLSRKARLLWDIPGDRRGTSRVGVRSIVPVPTVPTRCIMVDSPDSTYLAGRDLTVTHNTALIRRGVAWALDRDPTLPVIYTSYGAELALNSARAIRDYGIEHATPDGSDEGLRYRLRQDATKVGEWLTTEGGGLKATGISGALSGFPAGGIVIDDPHKNWQEAHSEAKQEAIWNLYRSVLRVRLRMGGWIIVIHTRWCFGDLTDRILNEAAQIGEDWRHVALPMIAETPDPARGVQPDPLGRAPGEVLEPKRFDLPAALARARALGSYLTAGMEQQRPAPVEGGMLKRAWWRLSVDTPDTFDEWITSWDVKMKDKADSGDFVVGQVWARVGSRFWCLAQFRGQWSMGQTKAAVALAAVRYPLVRTHVMENTGNGPEVMADLRAGNPGYQLPDEVADAIGCTHDERPLLEAVIRRGIPNLVENNPKGSKVARVMGVSGMIEAGSVTLVDHPFAYALIDEAAAFKGLKSDTDDQVDAMSQALAWLQGHIGGTTAASAAGRALPTARPGTGVPARMAPGGFARQRSPRGL